MLLMARNVCWTAAMTKRKPGQGGRLSSGVLLGVLSGFGAGVGGGQGAEPGG